MAKPILHTQTALERDLVQRFYDSDSYIAPLRATWDDKEAILLSRNTDKLGASFKSQVNDGRLSTIILERSARVMDRRNTGDFRAITIHDTGKSELMGVAWDNYVIPGANSQFPYIIKMRMWDMYSMVYGSMPMLYDYTVSPRYVGPDFFLLRPRQFFPQPGKMSIEDMDHAQTAGSFSLSWLKDRSKSRGWVEQAIKYIADQVAETGRSFNSATWSSTTRTSFIQRNRNLFEGGGRGDFAQLELRTEYQRDRWITYCPDFENIIVRDMPNPHRSERLPIVMKHCFPLMDSLYGLGDVERGETLQKALNSLINLYLDGVKMSIFPPVLMDANGVVMSSIQYSPAAKWLVTKPGAIDSFRVSPQGLDTFQEVYGFMIAAVMNQNGTTDTSITKGVDPGFGKTPEAIRQQAQRESSRDAYDSAMMDAALKEITECAANLMVTKQEKPFDFTVFNDEAKLIAESNPDVTEMFDSEKAARVTVKKKDWGGAKYFYFIDPGSTRRADDDARNKSLVGLFTMLTANPNFPQMLAQEGYQINFPEILKQIGETSGLPHWDKFIQPVNQQPQLGRTPDNLPAIPGVNTPDPNSSSLPQPMMAAASHSGNPELDQIMSQILGGQQPFVPGAPQGAPAPQAPQGGSQ